LYGVRDILSRPENYEGTEVLIIGYYRGWNMLKVTGGKSPVTRSGWIIRDRCGAIYVQAGGECGGGLNPGSLEDTHKGLHVKGNICLTEKNNLTLKPPRLRLFHDVLFALARRKIGADWSKYYIIFGNPSSR